MIICKECGNSAESVDGFCSSCGVLLEWSGQPVAAKAAAGGDGKLATRRPEPERGRPDPLPLAEEPEHTGLYCSSCGVRNPPGRTFCRSCGDLLRDAVLPAASRPGWWRRLVSRLRGRPAAAGQPPGAAPAAQAEAAGSGGSGGPGGSRSPAGSGPAPAAGAGSGPGPAASRLGPPGHHQGPGPSGASRHPWQSGVQQRGVRPPRRPQARRLMSPRTVIVILGILSLLGVSVSPLRAKIEKPIQSWISGLRQHATVTYVNLSPVSAIASSAAPGHPASLAIDGPASTYWLTGGDSGVGASITIRFAGPVSITKIGILSGEPGGSYFTQGRPENVTVTGSAGRPEFITFTDQSGFETQTVALHDVTSVTLTITSEYDGQQGQSVAIRELQFSELRVGSS